MVDTKDTSTSENSFDYLLTYVTDCAKSVFPIVSNTFFLYVIDINKILKMILSN